MNTNHLIQELHLRGVSEQQDHYENVIVMLLARRSVQHIDLSDHIKASEKLVKSLEDFTETAHTIVSDVRKQIEPSAALCDGMGTILDGPGRLCTMLAWMKTGKSCKRGPMIYEERVTVSSRCKPLEALKAFGHTLFLFHSSYSMTRLGFDTRTSLIPV
jgi:hypothetical protein